MSFIEAARSAGYAEDKNEDLSSVFLKKGSYFAFIELHIEQGPILEEEGRVSVSKSFLLFLSFVLANVRYCLTTGLDIGIVTAIAAPASLKVEFEGNGGHAGAVLMPYR